SASPPGRLGGCSRLTIAFLLSGRLWPTRFEASLDRRVVREAEPQTVPRELSPLGWPGVWRFDDLEGARQQVVDRTRMGGPFESEALAQGREDRGVLGGSQVEIAAEEQRRISRPLGRGLGGAQDVGGSEVRSVVGRVQVGDTEVVALSDRDAS